MEFVPFRPVAAAGERMMRPDTLIVMLALAASIPVFEVQAATWIVDPDGGGDATTIQGAVDLASPGDEIVILAGTYDDHADLGTGLRFVGQSGAGLTTVTAPVDGASLFAGGVDVTLEGLTLSGAAVGYGYCERNRAIEVAGTLTLVDCVVEDNETALTPVYAWELYAYGTTFRHNSATGQLSGCGQIDPDPMPDCLKAGYIYAENCVFEEHFASQGLVDVYVADFVRCTFRNNDFDQYGAVFVTTPDFPWGLLSLHNNLFHDNEGSLLGFSVINGDASITTNAWRNTFARNQGMFGPDLRAGSASVFHANVFTGADVGFQVQDGMATTMTVTCNDSWGNGTDWVGLDPGAGGNFSLEPKYCAPEADIFTVAQNSPLLPANNACGELIGAFGQGCGTVSVEPSTWAKVKSLYRGD
jgi:hypothetical protein